ncbi:unnamed protein product [Nezara viridula]|uniref:Uncharacterized protein n=1 Tax=Nezara viridula TaxID=85310 RepID=A0A9P0MSC5_NEZVI|nr:unnamed protein product [Nezara viridula]
MNTPASRRQGWMVRNTHTDSHRHCQSQRTKRVDEEREERRGVRRSARGYTMLLASSALDSRHVPSSKRPLAGPIHNLHYSMPHLPPLRMDFTKGWIFVH